MRTEQPELMELRVSSHPLKGTEHMLTIEEIQAAESEKMFVISEESLKNYSEFVKIKAKVDLLTKQMDALKMAIRDEVESKDANSLIDPETGRKMVTYSVVTRETADKSKMIEELGEDVIEMYFKKTTSSRMTIN